MKHQTYPRCYLKSGKISTQCGISTKKNNNTMRYTKLKELVTCPKCLGKKS